MLKKSLIFLSLLTSLSASDLELGFGAGTLSYPDYLGSDEQNFLAFPFPYVVYSSDDLKIDREGLEQKLFAIEDLSLQLSVSGSLPVKSSGIRTGMNDLDPALEVGPALIYDVYNASGLDVKLVAPLRAVISSDFTGVDYRGYIYELKTEIEYQTQNNYLFQFHTGAVWADKKYHDYLYGVESKFATSTRTAYDAKAGYSGYKTSLGLSKKFNKLWVGAFVRHYSLNDSAFENSPLKVKNSALYGGLFTAYIFDKSFSNQVKAFFE